ncbi:extracellular solute-binding protein [Mesorhizobium captivum]|uniref:extracellular solute-binding protein n=1 Tax=Mesorhizobium captivum TaxID=3072319 RepID=UPI002A24C288|nr:extracellular solute-binding protein [Mesorhizobium sp. VK3C]MDX8450229.1 extracellular solute-binding protein [Mesorhizobium sp. VK3C]
MKSLVAVLGLAFLMSHSMCSTVAAQDVSLRLLHSTPMNLYQAVNERFRETHLNVSFREDPAPVDYDALTQGLLRAAVVGDLPDVVFQGYNRIGFTVERGLAVPLDGFVSRGNSQSNLDMCAVNGKLYGLPFATSVPIVFYNLDLISSAGHDPKALPTDWDGILSLARDINGAGAQGVFFDYATTGNWTFQALLASFGGRLVAPDGSVGFNDEAGRRALRTLARFRAAGQVDMSRSQAWQTFAAGGLGILISTSSLLPQFEQQSTGHFRLATGAFPMETPHARLPAGGNCAMILTKDPAKQRLAWDYIKFVAGPIGQTVVALKSGYIPMISEAVDNPKLLGDYYKEHPNFVIAVKQMPILTRFESFPGDNSIKITAVINDRLGTIMQAKADPNAALSAMASDVAALLPN